MHMSYWFGTDLGTFIFPGFNVTTTWGLVATCFGLGSLAIVFEGLKVVQIKLRQMTLASLPSEVSPSSEDSSLLSRFASRSVATSDSINCASWSRWCLEVLHWSMHTTLGYLLMLGVMSYNAYLSIALAIGGGIGYWFFGPTLQQLNMLKLNDGRKNLPCDPECSDAISTVERQQPPAAIFDEQLEGEISADVHT